MICGKIANITSIVEVLIYVFIAAVISHASLAIKHAIAIDLIHILSIGVGINLRWLASAQEIVVDLLVWINASKVLLLFFLHLLLLLSWTIILEISWAIHWWILRRHLRFCLWNTGTVIIHLFWSCISVILRWVLVIVVFVHVE